MTREETYKTFGFITMTREERHALHRRETKDWTDAELITSLIERYEETDVPPCRLCGGELSIQRMGGGEPTVWACAGKDMDGEYRPGRTLADMHYSESRFEDRRQGGDSDVMELIRRFCAEKARTGPSVVRAILDDMEGTPE